MKKEKKSPRSKMLEHRRHKPSRSHHKRQSAIREKNPKHHRSKSPSSSKRKNEEEKGHESPKPTTEVSSSAVKMDPHHSSEVTQFCNSFENVMNDKEKLIQELFEVICGDNLKKITPDALKNCPLDELKIMCLEELNRMTNAEIGYILSGKDPILFVPEVHSEDTKEQGTLTPIVEEHSKSDLKGKIAETAPTLAPGKPKELAASKSVSADDEQESASNVTGDTKSEAESDSLELCATQKEIDSLIQEEIINQTNAQGLAQQSRTDLTDMEILELELRARIIRSLLKTHGMEISDEDDGMQQKENVGMEKGNT